MTTVVGALKQLALAETYVDPGTGLIKVSDSIPLTPSFGIVWYRSIDFGFPDVRDSAQDNPQADGTYDETQYTGARSVSIEGVVIGDAFGGLPSQNGWPNLPWNSASYFITLLGSWALPSRRFRLYFTDEIGRSRFMVVRGDGFTSPLEKYSDQRRDWQLNLRSPSGKIYTFAQGSGATEDGRWTVPIAISDSGEDGRTYPETAPYNRDYPAPNPTYRAIRYAGTVPTGVEIRMHTGTNDLVAPRWTFTAPNGRVASIGLLPDVVIPAGNTVTVNTDSRTILVRADDDAFASTLSYYLAAPMQWPKLWPGINRSADTVGERVAGYNRVDFEADSVAEDATINVLYFDTDLS